MNINFIIFLCVMFITGFFLGVSLGSDPKNKKCSYCEKSNKKCTCSNDFY